MKKPEEFSKKNRVRKQRKPHNNKPDHLKSLLPYAAIFFAGFLLYLPTLSYPLDNLDEPVIITANLPLLQDFSNVGEILFRDAFISPLGKEFYRPLQNISFMLDARIAHGGVEGFRVMNLIYYCLTCCILFGFLQLFHVKRNTAFFFAFAYVIHPLFTHTAVWIPSRGDIFIAAFGMLSLLWYVKSLESDRATDRFIHVLFFTCALCSKETGIVLPALFALYYLLFKRDVRITSAVFSLVPDAIVIVIYLIIRSMVVKSTPGGELFGVKVFILNLATIPEVLAKFLFPVNNLSAMAMFTRPTTTLGIVFVVLILGWACFYRKQKWILPVIVFSFAWFLLLIAPGMFYRVEPWKKACDYLEHRTYMPLIGIATILALLLDQIKNNRQILMAGGVYLAFFVFLSYNRSGDYRNVYEFYRSIIRTTPQCAFAHNNLGAVYQKTKDYDEAMSEYSAALQISPIYATPLFNRARVEFFMKNFTSAAKDFDRAIELYPKYSEAYSGRGMLRFLQKDYSGALADFNAALSSDAKNSEAYNGRCCVFTMQENIGAAIRDFESAVRLNPANTEAQSNLKKLKGSQ